MEDITKKKVTNCQSITSSDRSLFGRGRDVWALLCMRDSREYLMIYRELGFLAVALMGSSPTPSPLDRRHTGRRRKRDNLLTVEGGRGRVRSRILWPQVSLVLYKSFIQSFLPQNKSVSITSHTKDGKKKYDTLKVLHLNFLDVKKMRNYTVSLFV